MKPLSREISLTIIIKLTLLFALWFVCFKNPHKTVPNIQEWFFGAPPIVSQDTHTFSKIQSLSNPPTTEELYRDSGQ